MLNTWLLSLLYSVDRIGNTGQIKAVARGIRTVPVENIIKIFSSNMCLDLHSVDEDQQSETLFFLGWPSFFIIRQMSKSFWFLRHKTANIQHERYPLRLPYFQAVALFCSRSNPRATLSADCTKSGWLSLQRSNTTYDSTNVHPSSLDCFYITRTFQHLRLSVQSFVTAHQFIIYIIW